MNANLKTNMIKRAVELLTSVLFATVCSSSQAGRTNDLTMVTIGDSIIWGVGLPESMKFRNIVAQWLDAEYHGTREVQVIPTRAHTGADTGWGKYDSGYNGDPDNDSQHTNLDPAYPGEIPRSYPSISKQIELTVEDLRLRHGGMKPEQVDLILIDGGINDVNVRNILNVSDIKTDANWVRKITREICVGHMAKLLPQVLQTFTNATVVIVGYYPIISDRSDTVSIAALLSAIGIDLSGGVLGATIGALAEAELVKPKLVERSMAFDDEAHQGLTTLVKETNKGYAIPRVFLAWPEFEAVNCYGGPQTYLFTVGQLLGDEIRGRTGTHPEDQSTLKGVAYTRAQQCWTYTKDWVSTCYDASMGHPNPAGSQAYANEIIRVLQTFAWKRLGLPPAQDFNLLVASGSPVVRFTGSMHDWSRPVSVPAAINNSPLSELKLTITTGGDDLRGGSTCDAILNLRSGTCRKVNINSCAHWNNGETHSVMLSLPPGTKAGDILSLTLHTGFGGGIGGDNWNVDQVVLTATVSASQPLATSTPSSTHTWLESSGSPLIRFTGSVHDWERGVVCDRSENGKPISQLNLRIVTGNDDLRGGNRPHDNCDAIFGLASGRTLAIANINKGQHWNNNESHSVTIPLPAGTKVGDIVSLSLHTNFGGGLGGDNWNVNKVVLEATY